VPTLKQEKKGTKFHCTQNVENPVSAKKLSSTFFREDSSQIIHSSYTPLAKNSFLLGFCKHEFD